MQLKGIINVNLSVKFDARLMLLRWDELIGLKLVPWENKRSMTQKSIRSNKAHTF